MSKRDKATPPPWSQPGGRQGKYVQPFSQTRYRQPFEQGPDEAAPPQAPDETTPPRGYQGTPPRSDYSEAQYQGTPYQDAQYREASYEQDQFQQSADQQPRQQTPPRKGNLSMVGLVLGIIAVVAALVPNAGPPMAMALGLAAIVLGIVGLVKKHGATAIISMAFGVVALVLSVVMTVAVYGPLKNAAASAANSILASANAGQPAPSADAETQRALRDDVRVSFGNFTPGTESDWSSVPVTVTNISQQRQSYNISISAVNANGTEVEADSIYIPNLEAGQSTAKTAFKYIDTDKMDAMKSATYTITRVLVIS
ncbi:Hypothetical protein PFR_JS12-1_1872 [Propionibacterium freudenreichii]|uniref:DUF4190 domain-containing protein n=1 Tax=Propionibacterium freudenreichii TaxID=1744 RepID=UPI000BC358FB|nr:DUF4190 domain-containing protein [Propionibacterium freudenreichii]SBN96255.1 Hypothetical protein PFR_JS12-2_1871 [Propionibacterium freudenreichii]SCC97840.1 Hypothetical protein PFR_JS12-1_1872 [Propionibacterium freudenreichii]